MKTNLAHKNEEHSTQRFSFPTLLITQIQLNTQNFILNISPKPENQNPTKSTTKHLNHPHQQQNNIAPIRPQIINKPQRKPNHQTKIHKFQPKSSNHKSSKNPKENPIVKPKSINFGQNHQTTDPQQTPKKTRILCASLSFRSRLIDHPITTAQPWV